MSARVALRALALAALAACDGEHDASQAPPASAAKPWFEEVARERGLVFEHESGHRGRYLFPETVCGGVALFDMDGDLDLDCYLVQAGSLLDPPDARPPNRLFRNRGDGFFEDATEGSGAGGRGYGMGVATGDYDADGDVDLYVTNLGPNVLLRNEGAGRFVDVTDEAGVGESSWSSSAAFVDHDADGDLDLFVANYVRWTLADELECETPPHGADYCSPKSYDAPAPDTLYRNEGDGRFRDVSSEVGLRTAFGNGLGVLCADFDGDGATEIFVANDGTVNQLWRWRPREQRFVDEAVLAGCAMDQDGVVKAGMGVAAADVDDDGDEDLLVVNLAGESDSLFRNDGRWFSDRSARSGLGAATRGYTRFGCALADFDGDGLLDLFQATGRVTKGASAAGSDPYAEPDLLMRGLGGGRFEELAPRGGTAEPLVETSRGLAIGDVDGDGALDLVVVNRDGPVRLLRNLTGAGERSARVRLRDERGRDALGARLSVRIGARHVTRVLRTAYGYCSAHEPVIHLGLGAAERADELEVRWPDGSVERFDGLRAGEERTLVRGTGSRG